MSSHFILKLLQTAYRYEIIDLKSERLLKQNWDEHSGIWFPDQYFPPHLFMYSNRKKKKAPFKLAFFFFLFNCYSFFYSFSIHLKALLQIFYVAGFPEISPFQHRGDYFRVPSPCGNAPWCLKILSLSSELLLIPVAVVCMNSWYLLALAALTLFPPLPLYSLLGLLLPLLAESKFQKVSIFHTHFYLFSFFL